VASSQGFEYILQDEEFDPVDENEKTNYKLDLTFIYDDFQNRNGQMPWIFTWLNKKTTKNG